MAAKPTAKKAAAKPRPKALATVEACEAELEANRSHRRGYEAARKVQKSGASAAAKAKAAKAQESHRVGYNAYWRAYRVRRTLRKEAS